MINPLVETVSISGSSYPPTYLNVNAAALASTPAPDATAEVIQAAAKSLQPCSPAPDATVNVTVAVTKKNKDNKTVGGNCKHLRIFISTLLSQHQRSC